MSAPEHVVRDAASVSQVLADRNLRVRPGDEPVPNALAGHPLGEIFGRLVRMIDGPEHDRLKAVLVAVFDELDDPTVDRAARNAATSAASAALPWTGASLDAYCAAVPTRAIAALLGFGGTAVADAGAWGRACARAISPSAGPADVEGARFAAASLRDALETLPRQPNSLMENLCTRARTARIEDASVIANALGFFTQAHDATTGLIANALALLLREPETSVAFALETVVRDVSPVRTTRRFVPGGGSIVVDIAAANGEVASVADAFTFGRGVHACPVRRAALVIARAAVAVALEHDVRDAALAPVGEYPYSNVRIARFGT